MHPDNFNSIKVRLKPRNVILVLLFDEFQFHKGTIKTLSTKSVSITTKGFQFHKGTIKTFTPWAPAEGIPYFNSIKVRLKPVKSKAYTPEDSIGLRVQRYKKNSEKCRCLKIFFLRSYDNLPIYGGFNKSKNTFGGFAELKTAK